MDMTFLLPGLLAGGLPVLLFLWMLVGAWENPRSEFRPEAGVVAVLMGLALVGILSGILHGILLRGLREPAALDDLWQLGAVLGGLGSVGGFLGLVRVDRATIRRPKGAPAQVVASLTRLQVFKTIFLLTFFSAGLTVLLFLFYAILLRERK